jgi:GTPase SAR1 family protein
MSKQEIKLCLLGETAVGKSCLGTHFVFEEFNPHLDATISAVYMSKAIVVGDRALMLHIWDTAEQKRV